MNMQQTAPGFFNSLKKKVTNVASGLMPATAPATQPMAGGRRRKSRRSVSRKQRKSRRSVSRKQRKSRRSSRK